MIEDSTSTAIGFMASHAQGQSGSESLYETQLEYAQTISTFRDTLRSLAIASLQSNASLSNSMSRLAIEPESQNQAESNANANASLAKQVLSLCDRLRDHELFELGIVLEDREGGQESALVKLVDRDTAVRMRQEKREREAAALARKAELAAQTAQRHAERAKQAAIPPNELFRSDTESYSAWDESGIPTHDASGVELAKSKRKKLVKEWEAQQKLYEQHVSAK